MPCGPQFANSLSCISVLNISFLEALLDANRLLVSDKDLLFAVKLELIIDGVRGQLLDLVFVEHTSPYFLEVPGYEIVSCRSDNRGLFSIGAEVVEFGGLEVNAPDSVLSDILRLQLKLEWVGLFLAHAVLKASLAIGTHRGHAQEISLRGGQDPLSITANFNALDRVTKPRK